MANDEDNAAYIVHACNAYPLLVGALRDIAFKCDQHAEDGPAPSSFEARALLEQLGEGSW
jgi:hypothetical protein